MTTAITATETVGEYTIRTERHGNDTYYRFELNGAKDHELYPSLDYCLVAAIAAKHTGRRGAGGSGVGTAADWFMAMMTGWQQ